MNSQKKITKFIESASIKNELCFIVKALPLSNIKCAILEEIKKLNVEQQLQICYKILSIIDLLHDDMLQYIISFNEFEETRLINKKFNVLTEKNEKKYYKELYELINENQDNVSNKTYIVNQNKLSLHSIERKLKYIGPYCDLNIVIKKCNDGDRVLVHSGTYPVYDAVFIEKNIQIIGLTNTSYMECDKTTFINSDNIELQNMKILSYNIEQLITICRGSGLKAFGCSFESAPNIITQTLIWVCHEANLMVNNCEFREAKEAVGMSPIAQHIDIRKCHFVNIIAGQAFGCITIYDEDEGIEGMVALGYSPLNLNLTCNGNVFEKIGDNYPFVELWTSLNKTYSIHKKECYIIKDNVIIDKHDLDVNKLYQIKIIS